MATQDNSAQRGRLRVGIDRLVRRSRLDGAQGASSDVYPRLGDTRPFTRWLRSFDGPRLTLVVDDPHGGPPLEWRTLDVRSLGDRPDLMARIGPIACIRLAADAAAAAVDYLGVPFVAEAIDGPHGEFIFLPVATTISASLHGCHSE